MKIKKIIQKIKKMISHQRNLQNQMIKKKLNPYTKIMKILKMKKNSEKNGRKSIPENFGRVNKNENLLILVLKKVEKLSWSIQNSMKKKWMSYVMEIKK